MLASGGGGAALLLAPAPRASLRATPAAFRILVTSRYPAERTLLSRLHSGELRSAAIFSYSAAAFASPAAFSVPFFSSASSR